MKNSSIRKGFMNLQLTPIICNLSMRIILGPFSSESGGILNLGLN